MLVSCSDRSVSVGPVSSRNSSVGWVGRLKNRGWVPVRVEILSSIKLSGLLGGGEALTLLFSRYLRLFPNGICGRGLKLTTHLSLEVSKAIPSPHHVHSWRAQGPQYRGCRLVLLFLISVSLHATSCVGTLMPVMSPAVWPYRPSCKQFLHIRPVCPKISASRNERASEFDQLLCRCS